MDSIMESWVQVQFTLLVSQFVWLSRRYKWAADLREDAIKEWKNLIALFPNLPPLIEEPAMEVLENAVRNYYLDYEWNQEKASYIDEDGFTWPPEVVYFNPWGADYMPLGFVEVVEG